MIKGQIIVKLSDGSIISYANKYLANKTGNDEANPSNLKFPGFSESCYYYTGFGNDTYDQQTDPGMIKADYEFLISQMDKAGHDILIWPEDDEKKIATAKPVGPDAAPTADDGTEILVRSSSTIVNTGYTFNRTKVFVNEVVSINVIEDWVTYPYGRESGYQLPKNSPNFHGFAEGKEIKESEKGPDFNKYWTTDNGYIPKPDLYLDDKNVLTIKNESSFTKVVKQEHDYGWSCYGVRTFKDEFGNVTGHKNSGSSLIYFHPIIYTITKHVNNSEMEEFVPNIFKAEEGKKIEYDIPEDTPKFAFIKWTKDAPGKEDVPEMPEKDFEIFAQWETKSYTVTKDLNYGSSKPTIDTVKVGALIDYGAPVRAGYSLKGWSLDPEGKEVAPKVMGTQDFTAYAVWEKVPEKPVTKTTKKAPKKPAPTSEAALEPIDNKE